MARRGIYVVARPYVTADGVERRPGDAVELAPRAAASLLGRGLVAEAAPAQPGPLEPAKPATAPEPAPEPAPAPQKRGRPSRKGER